MKEWLLVGLGGRKRMRICISGRLSCVMMRVYMGCM